VQPKAERTDKSRERQARRQAGCFRHLRTLVRPEQTGAHEGGHREREQQARGAARREPEEERVQGGRAAREGRGHRHAQAERDVDLRTLVRPERNGAHESGHQMCAKL